MSRRIGVDAKIATHRSAPRGKGIARACLLFASAATLLFVPAALSGQISLATAVDLAQRESSTVKLAAADMRKGEAVLAEAKDVYMPNLILGSSVGPPSIGFSFSQPSIASASMQSLAFSRSQGKYIEAAKVGIEAASLNLKDAREQVALDASTAYIELDTVSRELEVAHQQSAYSDRLVQIEQERSDAGVDSRSDLLQARLTAAQLHLRMLHLESRAGSLISQLAALTGLPAASIKTDHASIPEIPAVRASETIERTSGIQAAEKQAASRQLQARGDYLSTRLWPQIGFGAQYNRDATSLGNYNTYFGSIDPTTGKERRFKADNFSAGFNIQISIYDRERRDKALQSAAEALRATVEAEQAQRQNDVQIANLTGNLRELDALAEIANLKQEISAEQLKAVQTQLESGNGAGPEPGATPQLTPKFEQQARIDERQKYMDALDTGFDLSKARLSLLRALGHMDDWLHTLGPADPSVLAQPATGNHP
jgi:outer membrane protein TolC